MVNASKEDKRQERRQKKAAEARRKRDGEETPAKTMEPQEDMNEKRLTFVATNLLLHKEQFVSLTQRDPTDEDIARWEKELNYKWNVENNPFYCMQREGEIVSLFDLIPPRNPKPSTETNIPPMDDR